MGSYCLPFDPSLACSLTGLPPPLYLIRCYMCLVAHSSSFLLFPSPLIPHPPRPTLAISLPTTYRSKGAANDCFSKLQCNDLIIFRTWFCIWVTIWGLPKSASLADLIDTTSTSHRHSHFPSNTIVQTSTCPTHIHLGSCLRSLRQTSSFPSEIVEHYSLVYSWNCPFSDLCDRETDQDHRDDALDLEAQDEVADPTLANALVVVEVTNTDEAIGTVTEIETDDQEVL